MNVYYSNVIYNVIFTVFWELKAYLFIIFILTHPFLLKSPIKTVSFLFALNSANRDLKRTEK